MTKLSLLRRIFVAVAVATLCSTSVLAQGGLQDTIVKTICWGMTPPDKSYFNFDGGGHIFDVSYSADEPGIISFQPASPQSTTIGPPISIDVFASAKGSYTVRVDWECVDQGCHERGTAYVRFEVRECGPCMFRDYYSGFDGKKVITVPYKEYFPRTEEYRTTFKKAAYSANSIYEFVRVNPFSDEAELHKFYTAPEGRTFVSVTPKTELDDGTILILLDDGSTYITTYMPWNWLVGEGWLPPIPLAQAMARSGETFVGFLGDDLYVVRSGSVDVSRDGGKTWQLDTAGLGTAYIADAVIDKDQIVYLATGNGVFRQALTENVWTRLEGPGTNFIRSILTVDATPSLIIGTNRGVYTSTNNGTDWVADTVGLSKKLITRLAAANGYLFAVAETSADGQTLYRRPLQGGTWENIHAGIASFFNDPLAVTPIHSLGGDTILTAATTFGLLSSADNGTTWFADNGKIIPENMYGMVRDTDNKFIISSNQGIFKGLFDGAPWTKLYPSGKAFNNGNKVYRDDSGWLYTLGKAREGFMFRNNPMVSRDHGQTWEEQTEQLDTIGYGEYYTDRIGRQYIASYGTPMRVFTKDGSNPWVNDEAGIAKPDIQQQSPIAFFEDRDNIYLSSTMNSVGEWWRRPISGGAWTLDTAGANGRLIFAMAVAQSGELYAGTLNGGIIRYSAGQWHAVAPPAGLPASSSVFALSIDASNTLVAAYGHYSETGLYVFDDVYFSKDLGATWQPGNLAGVTNCNYMKSFGDTTYLLTTSGVYSFWSGQGTTDVDETPLTIAPNPLSLYPNPASSELTVALKHDDVTVTTLDIVNAKGDALMHRDALGTFNTEGLPAGTYYLRATTSIGRFTKPFVIVR